MRPDVLAGCCDLVLLASAVVSALSDAEGGVVI